MFHKNCCSSKTKSFMNKANVVHINEHGAWNACKKFE